MPDIPFQPRRLAPTADIGGAQAPDISAPYQALSQLGGKAADVGFKMAERHQALKEKADMSDYSVEQRNLEARIEEEKAKALQNGVSYQNLQSDIVEPMLEDFEQRIGKRGYSKSSQVKIGQLWGEDSAIIRQREVNERTKMEISDYVERLRADAELKYTSLDPEQIEEADSIFNDLSEIVGAKRANQMREEAINKYNEVYESQVDLSVLDDLIVNDFDSAQETINGVEDPVFRSRLQSKYNVAKNRHEISVIDSDIDEIIKSGNLEDIDSKITELQEFGLTEKESVSKVSKALSSIRYMDIAGIRSVSDLNSVASVVEDDKKFLSASVYTDLNKQLFYKKEQLRKQAIGLVREISQGIKKGEDQSGLINEYEEIIKDALGSNVFESLKNHNQTIGEEVNIRHLKEDVRKTNSKLWETLTKEVRLSFGTYSVSKGRTAPHEKLVDEIMESDLTITEKDALLGTYAMKLGHSDYIEGVNGKLQSDAFRALSETSRSAADATGNIDYYSDLSDIWSEFAEFAQGKDKKEIESWVNDSSSKIAIKAERESARQQIMADASVAVLSGLVNESEPKSSEDARAIDEARLRLKANPDDELARAVLRANGIDE